MTISRINAQDLTTLSNYNFVENGSNKQNTHLLGLKWERKGWRWKKELIIVNKMDVTCLSLFLGFFGIGKLKHTSVSLNKISDYLSQYKWEEIKSKTDQNSQQPIYKAFKIFCHIANRQAYHFKFELFKRLSEKLEGDFNHYWNPAIEGRFLHALHVYRLPRAVGVALRFKDSKEYVLLYQKLTKQDVANIEVGYQYEDQSYQVVDKYGEREEKIVRYLAPPPYFRIQYPNPPPYKPERKEI